MAVILLSLAVAMSGKAGKALQPVSETGMPAQAGS